VSAPKHCRDCPSWKKSVFHGLGAQELGRLAEAKQGAAYERGGVFNAQGTPADEVYCLAEGSAKITHSSKTTSAQSIVRIAGPGDLLGYRCIFSEPRFRATASALGPTVACKIDRSLILDLIRGNPEFALEMLRKMGQEVAAAENHHHSFCQKNIRERVAEALMLLKRRCGKPVEGGWLLDIQLTRAEMANWVGAAKESVIRCLSDMREEGLVRQEGDAIVIADLEKLAAVAGVPASGA
jgi:CRP-like cAMP-binding protein